MPYASWKDAPPHVLKRGRKAAEKWVETWNAVHSKTKDEPKAFAVANSVIGSRADQDTACIGLSSDVFSDWNEVKKYKVEYIRSGYWEDFNGQGEVYVTNVDLADGIEAFEGWKKKEGWATNKRRPFLDYNHGITNPKLSDKPNIAAGWMSEAWIEDMDGNRVEPEAAAKREDVLRIMCEYEVTDEANEGIKTKSRALFSPTFIPSGSNERKGTSWKFEILGGALTNIPFFEGLEGFTPIVASGRAAVAFAIASVKYRADSYISIRCPEPGEDLEAKFEALGKMGFEVDSFYQGPRPLASAQRAASDGSGDGQDESGKPGEKRGVYPIVAAKSVERPALKRGAIELTK